MMETKRINTDVASRRLSSITIVLIAVTVMSSSIGCNRAFYRRQADREVYCLIGQADSHTPDDLSDYRLGGTPASRYFDPYSADCPPMPTDDPQSNKLMHCVDCKKGWPFWDANGHRASVENPSWLGSLPQSENGEVLLDRGTAMSLALKNSSTYQRQLESLYFSALDVTAQRFRFDVQFFGGNDTFFTVDGRDRPGGPSSLLTTDTDIAFRKLFATGGELAVGLANGLVWQFAGPDTYSGLTVLDFSVFQPLLRGAGRAVILERLTDSERALLANTRQMERYRKTFYGNIIAGRSTGPGPSSSSLSISTLSGAPVGVGGPGGIYALLENEVQIRNQRANVQGLQSSYELFVDLNEFGRVDRLQVAQVQQQLFSSQSRLLSLVNSNRNELDAYKITLGLPPDLPVALDDPLLDRFNLISPELAEVQRRLDESLRILREDAVENRPLRPELIDCLRMIAQQSVVQRQAVDEDYHRLLEAVPIRREQLLRMANRQEVIDGDLDRQAFSVPELIARIVDLTKQYGGADNAEKIRMQFVSRYAEDIPEGDSLFDNVDVNIDSNDPNAPPTERMRKQHGLRAMLDIAAERVDKILTDGPVQGESEDRYLRRVISVVGQLSSEIFRLTLIQALARVDTVTLTEVSLDPCEGLEIARNMRLDWMNARASLVDVWRQIQVAANDLRSDLDITVDGSMGTIGDNPLHFSGTNGRLRLGLEFDAPLTRLLERNEYRRTLIDYAQARRDYYTYEDKVNQSLRRILRDIKQLEVNFEIQRSAVHIAISQVDLVRFRLTRPPGPGESSKLSPTTARDLVQALSGLLSAENEFLSIWLNYETQRLALDLDLGTMRISPTGEWIDPGPITAEALMAENAVTPIEGEPIVVEAEDIIGPAGPPEEIESVGPPNGGPTLAPPRVQPAPDPLPAGPVDPAQPLPVPNQPLPPQPAPRTGPFLGT